MIAKLFFGIFLLFSPCTYGYELGVNVHGLSYHPDRRDSAGMRFREFNPGIGARFIVSESKRHVWLLEGGFYRNSADEISKYGGGGYRFKLPARFEIGPTLAFYHNPSQNSGRAVLAPLLVVSFRYKNVLIHAVPVPRYKDVNRNSVIGLYGTFNFWKSK